MDDLENVIDQANSLPKPKKHAGGRPRKWTEERCVQVADELMTWLAADPKNINLERYFIERGMWNDFLGEYYDQFPKFARKVDRIRAFLAAKISEGALTGTYNSRFAPFYLGARHGWHLPPQKVESDVKVQAQGLTINFQEVTK
jgi:hypothetical protein